MFSQEYYHATIRKYQVLVGALFSTIYIKRNNSSDGKETARFKVPLMFAKREKTLARLLDDPTTNRKDAIVLPAMGFELKDMSYDGERMRGSTQQMAVRDPNNKNAFLTQFVPVPYNFNFSLYIMVKNFEDGTKIIEQILPNFRPAFSATLDLIPELNIKQDVAIVLSKTSFEEVYPEDYKERVTIMWTLDFVLKGYLYGPVKDKPMIKFANVEYAVPGTANITSGTSFLRITTQPGLDANGSPTSNADITISYSDIDVDDNYGVVVVKTDL